MATKLQDQLAITPTGGQDEYESKVLPAQMGNMLPIAYGGCALGLAVRAGCATVNTMTHKLYSFQGHFLGPASTQYKLVCKVYRTRETRSFATRRVEVSQDLNGEKRVCVEVVVDFHVVEAPLFVYSAPPTMRYSPPGESLSMDELGEQLIREGKVSAQIKAEYSKGTFTALSEMFEARHCPEGMGGQNLWGFAKEVPTSQDGLPSITDRSSAEWLHALERLEGHDESMAATAFVLDGALALLPLSFDHLWFDDCGASSSLDFSLRMFAPSVDWAQYHLRERKTIAAGGARTFSESRLWDSKGVLVASMTQSCILRPKRGARVKAEL